MRAGPKLAVEATSIVRPKATGSRQFELFCQRFIVVPKGTGARGPLKLRPWQRTLVGSVWDPVTRPRLACWCLPRGQGKSSLVAALGLWDLMLGEEGASVTVVATDERQANIVFGTAARMVELNPQLESRVQSYRDRLVVPGRGATFQCLPAEPKRLEGLDPTLAIIDEIGVVSRETYEVVLLASGKRAQSTVLGIGTPGADPDNVLADLRALRDEQDASFVYREHSAAGFEEHPPECEHCWEVANPALDDFLHRDALTALLPPKTREATFRRARLCQPVTGSGDSFLQRDTWDGCADPERLIPEGFPVVLGLDGSRAHDATAVVAVSVEERPRIQVVGVWEPPPSDPAYRVPVLAVEDAIREAASRWQVRELTADPYGWSRTLQLLAEEGMTVTEFPQSAQRMSPATTAFAEAVHNHEVTHTGDKVLARHVLNAIVRDDARGVRVAKPSRESRRKIDALVATLMAHSRARWHATQRPARRRVAAFS